MANCDYLGNPADHLLVLRRWGIEAEAACKCGWAEAFHGFESVNVPEPLAGLLVAIWFDEAWDRHHLRAGLHPLDPAVRWEAFEYGEVVPLAERDRSGVSLS